MRTRSFKRRTSRKMKSRRIRHRSRSVKRSLKRSVKRSFKRKKSRKVKSRKVRFSNNIQYYNCKKYNIWDGGNKTELKVKYKIVELEGCGYCADAKDLIKKKGFTLEVKKELNEEEEKEIMSTLGKTYDYFPKIFEYNEKEGKYKFLGGFGKLKEKLN